MNEEKIISEGRLFVGATDYHTRGRFNCKAYITWELRETDKGPEFSAQAEIWEPREGDCMTCGQCVDTVAALFPNNKRAQEIKAVWEKYHLNGMRAGCEHQRANWNPGEEITLYYFRTNDYVRQALREAQAAAARAIQTGGTFTPTAEQTRLANLPDKITLDTDALPAHLSGDYIADGPSYKGDQRRPSEKKTAGWVKPSEHPKGLLCKPCEVCGYAYGTGWKYQPIPGEVVEQIKSWIPEANQ